MQAAIRKAWILIFTLGIFICLYPSFCFGGERFISNYPCKKVAKECVDKGVKTIEDEQVYKECWKYSYLTVCDYPSKDDCRKYSHCYYVQIVDCLLKDYYGYCVNQKKEFSCKKWIPEIVEEQKTRIDFEEKDGQEGLVCKGIPCIDVSKSVQ